MRLGKTDKIAVIASLIALGLVVGTFVAMSHVTRIDRSGYHYG